MICLYGADQINTILHEIITSDANINHVILADKTGLTLAYSSRFAFDEFETEALGAIASAVYLASEQQGTNVGLAVLDIIISEFSDGLILVASCGSTVVCLITDAGVALGMVRRTMKIAAEKIRNILDMVVAEEVKIIKRKTSAMIKKAYKTFLWTPSLYRK